MDSWYGDNAASHRLYGFHTGRAFCARLNLTQNSHAHDDVIKWKHFPRYWPFVRGIHRSPVNSPYKGQWRGAFMFSLISASINRWVNNREAGDLRRYRAHYDIIVMVLWNVTWSDEVIDYRNLCSLSTKSLEIWKPWVCFFMMVHNVVMWLALPQQCSRGACQISFRNNP